MTNRTITTAAIVLSLAAASAPAASAMPNRAAGLAATGKPAPARVQSRVYTASTLQSLTPQERERVAGIAALSDRQLAAGFDVAAPAVTKASPAHVLARLDAPQSGFNWGDAGIGAAGLALSLMSVGGGVAVIQRRSRRTTALPS